MFTEIVYIQVAKRIHLSSFTLNTQQMTLHNLITSSANSTTVCNQIQSKNVSVHSRQDPFPCRLKWLALRMSNCNHLLELIHCNVVALAIIFQPPLGSLQVLIDAYLKIQFRHCQTATFVLHQDHVDQTHLYESFYQLEIICVFQFERSE